ncbi:hypothetical protein AcdelDRAFT_4285, partial [Acidovorax delafieldii 2AN]
RVGTLARPDEGGGVAATATGAVPAGVTAELF